MLQHHAGWKYGFDSPFKAEVYFVSTTQITDLKWGTPNPVMMRTRTSVRFGFARWNLPLRASGTDGAAQGARRHRRRFRSDEITELLRSIIRTAFAEVSDLQIPLSIWPRRYIENSERAAERDRRIDDEYGLDLPQLYVVNISLPEAVEKRSTRAPAWA